MPWTSERTNYGTTLIRVSSSLQNEQLVSSAIVLCHGLGGKSENLIHVAEYLASQMPHVEFIIPTAPTRAITKNGGELMPAWYDVVGDERNNETYDGIDESCSMIKTILRDTHETRGIPYSKMMLAGFSQGAAISLFTGMQLEKDMSPLAGIVLLSGYLPFAKRVSQAPEGLDQIPILHLHGDDDGTVPHELAFESKRKLEDLGASYVVKMYKGLGHSISSEEIDDMLDFAKSKLPKIGEYDTSKRRKGKSHLIIALLVVSGVGLVAIRFILGSYNGNSMILANGASQEGSHHRDPESIRFNKFSIIEAAEDSDPFCSADLPLGPDNYLINGSNNANAALCMLMNHSTAVSVVTGDDWETRDLDIADLITAVGGAPSQPSSDESSDYWDRLEKVIDVQKIRLRRGSELSRVALPEFPLPYRWVEYTVNEVAEAVHDEYPGLHQSNLIADLMGGTYGQIKLDTNIIPQRSRVEFLRGMVMFTELNQWAVGRVGPYNFMAKWHVGRARPEEMVKAIQANTLAFVPHNIQQKVNRLPSFARPADFTAYPEGCPGHPSWPAMHAAASGMSFWLGVVLDISENQLCQAKLTDYAVAWGRTVAGVHYEDDNLAGLDMGQEVIANLLPEHLSNTYGADKAKVQAKVDAMRFSWRDFDPEDPCPGTDWMQWSCKSRTRRCSFRGSASVSTNV